MLYIFIVFLLISIYKISFKNIKTCDEEALSHDRTLMINGFFVGLILFSHFNSYLTLSSSLPDTIYYQIFYHIGQLMVTSFLFYSGYGILESIKNKKGYIDTFFRRRFLKLFISFAIALLLYIGLNLLLHIDYPIKTILLSFTGWESIGNSNWFIFATFCMYISVLISFKIFKKDIFKGMLSSLIGSLIYIILVWKFKRYGFWLDTILCFNLGMFVSYYKDNIIKFLKDKGNYILSIIILLLSLFICYIHKYTFIMYLVFSGSFILLIFLITLRVKIGNKVLLFLGKNTFNIYILQRLFYTLYKELGLLDYNMYLYFVVCIASTLVLAFIFDKLLRIVLKRLN